MNKSLDIFNDKEKFIDDVLKELNKDVVVIQRELLSNILNDYIDVFSLDEDGAIKNTTANILRATAIDRIVNEWNVAYQQNVLKEFTNRVFELAGYNKDYFASLKIAEKEKLLSSMVELEKHINATLGIKKVKQGEKYVTRLIKGGYLSTLEGSEPIKQELKSYVLESVNSNVGFKEYRKGFENILQKDGGIVDRYYKTYVYDSFVQIDRIESTFLAKRLGLKYFVYQGSLIKTSRPFCCKRAGKVFSIEDVDSWKCDVNLIGKPKGQDCDDSYRPLIELGRWNCRHSLRYMSDELAKEIGITESKDIIKRQGSKDCLDK
jgi:hypothetical protein